MISVMHSMDQPAGDQNKEAEERKKSGDKIPETSFRSVSRFGEMQKGFSCLQQVSQLRVLIRLKLTTINR